jgi:hypothetical protein
LRLGRAYDSLRVVAAPRAFAWPVVLSLVGWGLEGVALHLLLGGFGQDPGLSFSIFFYATATLAGALVPVPGGLGVTEAVIHEQLVHMAGAPRDVATACMLLIRLATLWWAVLVGFVALGLLRLEFPRELATRTPASPPLGEEFMGWGAHEPEKKANEPGEVSDGTRAHSTTREPAANGPTVSRRA